MMTRICTKRVVSLLLDLLPPDEELKNVHASQFGLFSSLLKILCDLAVHNYPKFRFVFLFFFWFLFFGCTTSPFVHSTKKTMEDFFSVVFLPPDFFLYMQK